MTRSALVVVAPVLAGCSLLYNPNNLPDPRAIDAAVADADPTMPAILDIAPLGIDEGQGDAGSLPALLVIHGQNLVDANLRVTLTPAGGATAQLDPITDAVVSSGHDYVAFTVTAHVDPALASDVPLDVTITQDLPGGAGTVTSPALSGKLVLHGHPEIQGGAVSLTAPLPTYSIVSATTLTLGGTVPAVVRSVSSISVGSVIADAAMTKPGPAGLPGSTSAGACATPGGGGGAGGDTDLSMLLATGGGGGGAGSIAAGVAGMRGKTGLGQPGGLGGIEGIKHGDDLIAELDADAACAGGVGGVGGTLVLKGTPGAGGAGGGSVALIARGDIQATAISARGGAGTPGANGGAGGGGGAGGNVVVRTDQGTLTIGSIDVSPGPGGAPNGGAGSIGRARWDAPGSDVTAAGAHRGAAFARLAARIVTAASPSLTVVGTSGDGFSYRVIDQDGHSFDGGHTSHNNGQAQITPALHPGYNQIWITLDGGAQGHPEADKFVDVALLP